MNRCCAVSAVLLLIFLIAPTVLLAQDQTPSEEAALGAYRQGEFDRAVQLYTSALAETEDASHRGRLHVNIAWTLFALGRESDSNTHLKASLLEDPNLNLDTAYYTQEFIDLFEKARIATQRGYYSGGDAPSPELESTIESINERLETRSDLEGALADVDSLLRAYPLDGRLAPTRIEILKGLGRMEEAEEMIRSYGDGYGVETLITRMSVPDLIMRANRSLDDGDIEGALEMLRKAVSRQPSNVAALELMADAAQRSSRWQEAEFSLKSALGLQPDNIGLKLRLGEIYLARGDASAARDVFRQITERFPHSDRAWAALGLLDARLGNEQRASRALQQALLENPLLPEVQLAHGEMLLKNGEADAALEALRQAANLLQEDPQLEARIGQALLARGKVDEALTHLRAAVDGEFRPFDVQRALALALMLTGSLAESERVLGSTGIDENRESDVLRALVMVEKGLNEEAEALVRDILTSRSNDAVVINLLAATLFQQKRYEEALHYLEQAHDLAPLDEEISANLTKARAARTAELLAAEARGTRNRHIS